LEFAVTSYEAPACFFADLFDVGEMVEISGQSGIVKSIGMRFVILENSYGTAIYIANRTVTNVINYPRGYVRCIADVTLSSDEVRAAAAETRVRAIAQGVYEQFPGILLTPPSIEGRLETSAGSVAQSVEFAIQNLIEQRNVLDLRGSRGHRANVRIDIG
jgi:small conductance mechanosensitive channel